MAGYGYILLPLMAMSADQLGGGGGGGQETEFSICTVEGYSEVFWKRFP